MSSYQNILINLGLFPKNNNGHFVAYFDEVYGWNLVQQPYHHKGCYTYYHGETIRSPGPKMWKYDHDLTRTV